MTDGPRPIDVLRATLLDVAQGKGGRDDGGKCPNATERMRAAVALNMIEEDGPDRERSVTRNMAVKLAGVVSPNATRAHAGSLQGGQGGRGGEPARASDAEAAMALPKGTAG